MKRALTQSYKALGTRPIANTYALYWHRDQSNLDKVAQWYCDLWAINGSQHHSGCLSKSTDSADIFNKAPKANAGFQELASREGLIVITENIWDVGNRKDNHHAKVTAHEYFHVYQGMMMYYFEKEDRIGIPKIIHERLSGPVWISEGGAEYFSYNVMGKYKWNGKSAKESYEYWMREALDSAKSEILDSKTKGVDIVLKNFDTRANIDKMKAEGLRAHFQYEGGAWAMAYLRFLTGTNKGVFTNYYKDIAELERTWRTKGKINYGWQKSFRANFGMTMNQFYAKFNRFMKWSTSRQMKILSAPLSR